jgi:hypothetical protein
MAATATTEPEDRNMASTEHVKPGIYGLMAEFLNPQQLLDAVKAARRAGYDKLDAFMPYPVEAISHEVYHHQKSPVSKIVLCGGLTGGLTGIFFQGWAMGAWPWLQELTYKLFGYSGYAFNIGGRDYFSWPAFIPVTFELTILFSAFSAVIGMFAVNGLPAPYHPVFNVKSFERATTDRFFLVIESEDPRFDRAGTAAFLEGLHPQEVTAVDW